MAEGYDRPGVDIDPQRRFDYKGVLFPSKMALEPVVIVHDYTHVFRVSVFVNLGAFDFSSYPEVPLSLAREERNVMSLFSTLNATITSFFSATGASSSNFANHHLRHAIQSRYSHPKG